MKTVAIYPGSFNPFHAGHKDVLTKALKTFETVIIAIGINPDKPNNGNIDSVVKEIESMAYAIEDLGSRVRLKVTGGKIVDVVEYKGLLRDYIIHNPTPSPERFYNWEIDAVIKGIRDTNDFLYEQKMQYHNEDLGITIPTYYIISDRKLVHISSSAIKAIERFKK